MSPPIPTGEKFSEVSIFERRRHYYDAHRRRPRIATKAPTRRQSPTWRSRARALAAAYLAVIALTSAGCGEERCADVLGLEERP